MAELFRRNWQVGLLQGGRLIAKGQRSVVFSDIDPPANVAMDIRIPGLRSISHVIEVEFYTSPKTYALWYEKWIHSVDALAGGTDSTGTRLHDANVVGITIYQLQAGTTLTVEVVAVGRP